LLTISNISMFTGAVLACWIFGRVPLKLIKAWKPGYRQIFTGHLLTLPIVLLFAAFVSADDPSMPLKRVLIVYGLAQLAAFGIDSLIFMRRIPPPIEPNTTPTGPN
jgi:hypothetical protein